MNADFDTAVYVHWPFCVRKCPYCDFNSHLQGKRRSDDFAAALVAEIKHTARELNKKPAISSVFFGGGTPSLMSGDEVANVLNALRDEFEMKEDCEITLEANPSSVERDKFKLFREAGVNRLSLGVQSFDDNALRFLGRVHDSKEALNALDTALNTFDRVSFDLIYALPDQTLEEWRKQLEFALSFNTDHLSLYQLTLEPKTLFASLAKQGKLHLPPARLKADFYRLTENISGEHGLEAYEISNYARKNYESRHNLTYWRYRPYIGIGPGAHGRVFDQDGTYARMRFASPDKWLNSITAGEFAYAENEALTRSDMALEAVLMGLRLKQGIDKREFETKIGAPIERFLNADMLQACIDENYLVSDANYLATTFEGRLRLESILEKILVF